MNIAPRRAGVREWWLGFVPGVVLLLIASYHGHFIQRQFLIPLVLVLPSLMLCRRAVRDPAGGMDPPDSLMPAAAALALCSIVYIYSNALNYSWFYLYPWQAPHGDETWNIHSGPVRFAIAVAFLLPLARAGSGWRRVFPVVAALAFCAGAGWKFLHATGGHALYLDDHPTFQYRLWIFKHGFPQLVNYVPMWNAGLLEFSGVETAANAVGAVLWPLWRWWDVAAVYSPALVILYIVIVPIVAAISIRAMGLSWQAAAIGAAISLGISRIYFLWLFHYGTVGANFTSAFVMPLMAGLYRVVAQDRRDWKSAVLLIGSVSILLMWPPGAIMVMPAALAVLLHARLWTVRKLVFLSLCAVAVLVIMSRELWIVLFATDVATHHWVAEQPASTGHLLADGWAHLRDHIRMGHPLLMMFGFGALFFWRQPMTRWFIAPVLGFAALAGWGSIMIPDLQLLRMAIPMFYVAIIPAAWLLAHWWCSEKNGYILLRAFTMALFVVAGLNAIARFTMDGPAHFQLRPAAIDDMAAWVKSVTPPNGRVLIAGGGGHTFGGGHVPYLPVLFDREMLCWDMCQDTNSPACRGSPPRRLPQEEQAYFQYIEAFDATTVITSERPWDYWMSIHPERFEPGPIYTWQDRTFYTYLVRGAQPNRFVRGSGAVHADVNRLSVDLDDAREEAVLRYRWLDGLTCDPPATIHPDSTPGDPDWIVLEPHGMSHVEIRYRHFFPWGRTHPAPAAAATPQPDPPAA